MILEQLHPLSFFCYRGYVLIFKSQPSLMWYVLAYYWYLLMAHKIKNINQESCWSLDSWQSVFLSKFSGEWGETRPLYSSILPFRVRRSLYTRLSDPKRKYRLPSLSSWSPNRTWLRNKILASTGLWVYSYCVSSVITIFIFSGISFIYPAL